MRRLCTLLFLVVAMPVLAATNVWFVDCNATGGLNNGTNWANAWTNFQSMSLSSIKAGEIVYISTGTYYGGTNLYVSEGFSGGSSTNLPVVFRVSREPGHIGKVDQHGGFAYTASFIVFDGSTNDDYKTTITNTYQVYNLTNGTICNWKIDGVDPVNLKTNVTMYGISGTYSGIEFRCLEICNNTSKAYTLANQAASRAFTFTPDQNQTDRIIIDHCWIHDVGWDIVEYAGVHAGAPLTNSTLYCGALTVQYCLVERIGQDFVEAGGFRRMNNNIIHQNLGWAGHNDVVSAAANYTEFYNNIVYDIGEQMVYFNLNFTPQWLDGHGRVYGNLFYCTTNYWTNDFPRPPDPNAKYCNSALQAYEEDGYQGCNPAAWQDFIFANNTIISSNALKGGGGIGWGNTKYTPPDTNACFTNITLVVLISNAMYLNNLSVQSIPGATMAGGFTGANTSYTTNNVKVDHNVIAGTTASAVSYAGTTYANAEAMSAALPYKSNYSAFPVFVNSDVANFALTNSDTAARNRGTNLVSLGLLGWETDLAGHPRVQANGRVNIGAFADTSDEEDMLWHLTADNLTTNGLWLDLTTNAHDVVRMWDVTNWPTKLTGVTDGASYLSTAARFDIFEGALGGGFSSGCFGAMTNLFRMTNLSKITVMAWVKYGDGTNGTHKIVSSSYGTNCTWALGRESALQTSSAVNTNMNYDDGNPAHVNFADNASTIYHHYAFTFDVANRTIENYLDGTNYSATTFTNTPFNNLSISPCESGGSYPGKPGWWAVGVNTHSGSPQPNDDGFPNNGWMNGELQELRVYPRILTSNQVNSAKSTGFAGGGGGGGGSTNTCSLSFTNTTPATNVFDNGMTLNLTADEVSGGNYFTNWNRGGVFESTNRQISVVVESNTTFTAVYFASNNPPLVVTILVGSTNPVSGVYVTNTMDRLGVIALFTPNDLSYYSNTTVTVTASATAQTTNLFDSWFKDGVKVAAIRSYTFSANSNYSLIAHYVAPPPTVATTNRVSFKGKGSIKGKGHIQ